MERVIDIYARVKINQEMCVFDNHVLMCLYSQQKFPGLWEICRTDNVDDLQKLRNVKKSDFFENI